MKAENVVKEIYDISKKVDLLDKKLSIIDSALKNIHNLIIKSNNLKSDNLDRVLVKDKKAIPRASAISDSLVNDTEKNEKTNKKLVLGSIKLFGYIKDSSSKYISNVKVKIKKDGSIIRESFSDNYGYWEARLPVGEYSIVFSHEDFEPYSKTVSLNNDKKEVEIR